MRSNFEIQEAMEEVLSSFGKLANAREFLPYRVYRRLTRFWSRRLKTLLSDLRKDECEYGKPTKQSGKEYVKPVKAESVTSLAVKR